MTLNSDAVARMSHLIKTWWPEDRAWFVRLLQKHPREAMVVAEVVLLLDARIVNDDAAVLSTAGGSLGRDGKQR